MYWQALIRPTIWPLGEFFLPVWWSSASVHPLGERKRSSLRIASAFANSSRPFISVQKPIVICDAEFQIIRIREREQNKVVLFMAHSFKYPLL